MFSSHSTIQKIPAGWNRREHYDPKTLGCSECSGPGSWAWPESRLCRRPVVATRIVDGADPACCYLLTCGHIVI